MTTTLRPSTKGPQRRKRAMTSLVPITVTLAALFIALPEATPEHHVTLVSEDGVYRFEPASVSVAPGTLVAFVNESPVSHGIVCEECAETVGEVQPGQTRVLRFRAPGEYLLACRYHRLTHGMQMTVRAGG